MCKKVKTITLGNIQLYSLHSFQIKINIFIENMYNISYIIINRIPILHYGFNFFFFFLVLLSAFRIKTASSSLSVSFISTVSTEIKKKINCQNSKQFHIFQTLLKLTSELAKKKGLVLKTICCFLTSFRTKQQ